MVPNAIFPLRHKMVLFVLLFTILLVVIAGTAFVADTTVLSNEAPTGTVDKPSFDGKWRLEPTLGWSDPNSVDLSTAVIKINGTPIQTYASYGYDEYDYYMGVISGASQEVALGGYYTIEASITNNVGYTATKTWTVLYNKNPETVTVTPYYDSLSNPPQPYITATIKDDFGGTIDQTSIKMYLDAQQVAHTYTSISNTEGIIGYTPPADLPDGSTHVVQVNYADTLGGAATTTWVFEVNSQPSMISATPAACTSCHFYKHDPYWTNYINRYFNQTHNTPTGGDGGLIHRCDACHREDATGVIKNPTGIVAPFIAPSPGMCAVVCHNNQPHNLENANHISDTNTSWYVYGGVSEQAGINDPRTAYDCDYCHQQYGRWPYQHQIVTKHTVSINEECASCHSAVLVREHSGPDRTDSQGNTLTCDTCHNNTSPTGNMILQLNTASMNTTLVVPPQFRFAESAPWSIAGRKITGVYVKYYGTGTALVYYYKDGVWTETERFYFKENGGRLVTIPEGEQIKLLLLVEAGEWGLPNQLEGKTVNLAPDSSNPITCALCHTSNQVNHRALHDVANTLETSCQQCHATNLMDEHQAKVIDYSCNICHSDTVVLPQGGNCIGCHSSSSTAHQSINHTAAPGSGPVVIFADAGHDDAGWTGDKPYFDVLVNCAICHNTDLPPIHGNDCATCHPTPFNTLGVWEKGCQQGGCHPSFHENSTTAHLPFENAECNRCHDQSWAVPQTNCLNCHAPNVPGDVTPPGTTSNVQLEYDGPAEIDFSIRDNGKVGLGRTFYRLDGGLATAVGKKLTVTEPGVHQLEFWSVDQSGNTETPSNQASFIIYADTTPPATTSNAQPAYNQGAVITLTATDDGTRGVKTTYYRLNDGPIQSGTTVVVPATSGTIAYTLTFWSEDWAGNVETQKSVSFTVTSGTGTIRLVWGDSDTNPAHLPTGDDWADWTIRKGGWTGQVVAAGSGASPNWDGVDDIAVQTGSTPYFVIIDWYWDGEEGQTSFPNVYVTTPGQVVIRRY